MSFTRGFLQHKTARLAVELIISDDGLTLPGRVVVDSRVAIAVFFQSGPLFLDLFLDLLKTRRE
jgi:hypothetical protein